MEIEIGRGKKARRAYGFDDIAIVPSRRTRDPDDVDISWKLGNYRFELPLLASAMDGVVSPATAGIVGKLGGLAVLNLEGIFTRYEDADEMLERIAQLPKDEATREMQEIYQEPVKPELIAQRIEEIKAHGVVAAASLTPQKVRVYHERRARHRRPAGDGDRRRRGRPLAAHARDRRVREGHRRRWDAQRRRCRQGDRLRRRRGDDRLAAGARLRGARPRLPLGHGDLPPDAPPRRARGDHAERDTRGNPRGAGARERRHVQPLRWAAHLDGDLWAQGPRRV